MWALLDSPPTRKAARTRADTTPGVFRGTDGSNPVSSGGQSISAVHPGAVAEKRRTQPERIRSRLRWMTCDTGIHLIVPIWAQSSEAKM